MNKIQKKCSTLNGLYVDDIKSCTAVAESRMWCHFFAKQFGGVGEDVVRMFSRTFVLHPASFTHLLLHTSLKAHTRLQTNAMKTKKELLETGAETGDSFEKHVCRLIYQQSAPYTPTSALFFWNMLNSFLMNQLLTLSNLKHIKMLLVFPVNDILHCDKREG